MRKAYAKGNVMAQQFEIGLVISSKFYDEFKERVNSDTALKYFLDAATDYIEIDKNQLWHWDMVVLSDMSIIHTIEWLQRWTRCDLDKLMVCIGDEDEVTGGWFDNPFGACLVKEFQFIDPRSKEEKRKKYMGR